MIELNSSAVAFEALSNDARRTVLRRLIPAGRNGVHAGAIAEAFELPPDRMSVHLNRLTTAGLIESRREGRHVFCAVRYAALGDLVRFLVDNCCAAAPEGCLPDCPHPTPSIAGGCTPSCEPG